MQNNTPVSKSKESKIGAGITGVSGGTLLITLAQQLPETNPYKSLLVLLAPTITVLLSYIFIWLKKGIDNYFKRKGINKIQDRIDKVINDPNTSDEYRKYLENISKQILLQTTLIECKEHGIEILIKKPSR